MVGVSGGMLPGCGPPGGGPLEIDRDIDHNVPNIDRGSMTNIDRRGLDSMGRRSSTGGSSVGGGGVDRASPTGSLASSHSQSQLTPSRQLSHAERLRKVLSELVETEASYVKVRKSFFF